MAEPTTLMEKIMHYNSIVNGFVWGTPMLCLLVGTGVYLTIILGMPQLRYFFLSLKIINSYCHIFLQIQSICLL